MNVKTRFAPSPTGYLHIGSLRTVLYNIFFAQKHGGTFLLRIEDTDQSRLVEGSMEQLIETFGRLGLSYDEGPRLDNGAIIHDGDQGPYLQSQRLETYQAFAKQLVDEGKAYYAFDTREELDVLRKQQQLAKLPTKYDRRALKLTPEEVQAKLDAGEPHVIRLKVPEGETTFTDAIRGKITIAHSEVDDQVLLKEDGFPTYHLAVVVDDHHMKVTHVIRGEEWISSVPKHIILYKALGFDLPVFAHLPLILNPDKSKLSKRQGDVAVEDFLKQGYLPEALINYIALLGFNPSGDQEVYTIDELTQAFELEKVNKGGAVFDRQKLDWMNAHYIKAMSPQELAGRLAHLKGDIEDELFTKISQVEQPRLTRLNDISESLPMYTEPPAYADNILVWKKSDAADAKQQLTNITLFLESLSDETWGSLELIETTVKGYIEDNDLQNGPVLWPLRVALSGQQRSPGPFELLWVLGKDESFARISRATQSL